MKIATIDTISNWLHNYEAATVNSYVATAIRNLRQSLRHLDPYNESVLLIDEDKLKRRKPISISCTSTGMCIICDDGSIWAMSGIMHTGWVRAEDVPQHA